MRRPGAVHGDDRPFVGKRLRTGTAGVHHRLDRDRKARNKFFPTLGLPVVGHLWLLVKFGAESVAHEITHDAELRALHDRLHGRPNVANMIARLRGVDTSRERLLRHVEQSLGLRIDLAHGDRDGAIGEVPFVTDADVDRDDVPILQYALWRRNAVHDLAIDRRADAAW